MPSDAVVARSIGVLLGLGIAGFFILRRTLRLSSKKDNGAFIYYFELLPPPPPPPPSAPHPLSGLTFAVKDIFDVEGFVTGFGNPTWAETHEPAVVTASAVKMLVEAGAKCVGKLHMDELAYSINGENEHYGTPVNPAAPNRIPGGSSSGSAVAVAANCVDFSLGTDTAGSVRVPAAFCGILGFRPSHAAISVSGVIPMAQSFDTVGWFARDPKILRQVGHSLLQLPFSDVKQPRRVLIADDCFKLSLIPNEDIVGAVIRSAQKLLGRQVLQHVNLGEFVGRNVPSLKEFEKEISNGSSIGALTLLRTAMQLLQRWEFKENHKEWLETAKPDLGADIAARAQAAIDCSGELISLVQQIRNEARFAINDLLKNDTVMVMPTVPDIPPKLNTKPEALDEFRSRAFDLICVSGMSGCCQASIPVGEYNSVPVAVSLLAKRGADKFLLDTVLAFYPTIQEEAKAASDRSSVEAAELAKEKGNTSFKEKDYKKAIGHYTDAIRMDGNNATYYNNRAMAYLQLCSFQEAEADCTMALGLDKKSVKAYLRRGTAREFLGYYKEANDDFRQALILEPTNKTASEALNRLKKLLLG
ncbi:hypothetical protein M758_3G124400 [Ceratodon purpureus]|uniref:Amidase domain-containing protein n=1 Tax=Ceratodon purpureus TaxID=3225 RepID=A0A8T0IK82_CERPU|nr:hypothetical protein KC19_3G122900 [Ceratodon purpureus]KAG0622800.1 hypothetical protein M758_3G124400 [Ceratodon purpureus]